ncbi:MULTISPECIES: hypothetical protein [unclassified Paenibacillus]|uniref:hypothetical protein n=1 Tax=unclassified Paenibacillus TaxID=185978 RepID=UPI003641C223
MSVSTECRKGDLIYVIDGFIAKTSIDENSNFDKPHLKELKVGEFVYFLDWTNKQIGDNFYSIIRYKDKSGEELEAVETYFVTEDVWNGLREYFKNDF